MKEWSDSYEKAPQSCTQKRASTHTSGGNVEVFSGNRSKMQVVPLTQRD